MADSNLIYGHHPVVEAISAGRPVEKVFFQQGIRGELEKEIRHLAKAYDIPLQVVPRERLDKMVRGNHQGVAAWLSLVEFLSLEDVVTQLFDQGEVPLLLLLDGVTDVRNFGAICRSALCLGAHAVAVPTAGAAPANQDAMKASAGALARVRLCRMKSIFNAVDWLQASGVQIVATALTSKSISLPDADLTLPTAIILGAEDTGVHPKLIRMADQVVKIPQAADFDSLNVSVASGVLLYEALRQRGK